MFVQFEGKITIRFFDFHAFNFYFYLTVALLVLVYTLLSDLMYIRKIL